ncbi:MAG: SIMPL domain-containing protein [Patescibacteria group bacterium]|nr:SIMPL domain-containing protein [Patescibacteria group bacterium]MDD5534900.1 SIMPL domain-containing protein [Patescibacteria group bacterium]
MTESKLNVSVILGVALIISALIFGGFYYFAQSKNSTDALSVTGSTKIRVTSDQAKLIINLSSIVYANDLSSGNRDIAHDLALTRDLLKKSGVADTDIVEGPVSMNQVWDQNNTGQIRYQLSQIITVQSNDVNKITDISKKIPTLSEQGAIISVQSLEYYYSKLPDLRVSLLTQAVQDAKARAEKIAEGTGRYVGSVISASNGVVQILTPNSVDISDYGNYDTSSIEKDVMVTIKASFRLK